MKEVLGDKPPTYREGLPVYYAAPLDQAKLVRTARERLKSLYNPDILLFFLRLQLERWMRPVG